MSTSRSASLLPESRFIWRSANPDHRCQLVCFPHAGASATAYASWAELLPEQIELIAVQLPGRQNRIAEPLYTETGPLVSAVCHALGPAVDGPTVFFGHSCGALLAFEVARQLRDQGRRGPDRLFLSAQSAPCVVKRQMLHTLPDAEFRAAIQALGGVAVELAADDSVLGDLLPLVRADFGLWERHEVLPGMLLPCPISGLAGAGDPVARPAEIEQWHRYTTGGFSYRVFPGGHFYHLDALDEVVGHIAAETLSTAKAGTAS